LRVMPETNLEQAKKYLKDASFALYTHRGLQGAGKGRNGGIDKELGSSIQLILNGRGSLAELESMLAEARESQLPKEKDKIELFAMRVKAIFYMALIERLRSL